MKTQLRRFFGRAEELRKANRIENPDKFVGMIVSVRELRYLHKLRKLVDKMPEIDYGPCTLVKDKCCECTLDPQRDCKVLEIQKK